MGFPDFHNPDFFRQVLHLMSKRLDGGAAPFVVEHHADVRSQLAALVSAMDRHRDPSAALRALADTLRLLRRDEAAVLRLDKVVDELAPAGRLPGSRLRAVVAQLDSMKNAVPLAAADEALRRALLPGEPSGLRGSESVSEMVARLGDARDFTAADTDPATHTPLVLRFLAELAGELPETEQALLRSHVSLAVDELGLPAEAKTHLAGRGLRPAARGGHRVLQIRLRETTPGKQRYTVDAALFDWTKAGLSQPRKREAERPFGLGELRQFGRTCLADWSDLTAHLDDADQVRVEFLLPWSLLGHPVERWLTDGHAYLLGHKYPVVIRSLDRMEKQSWHRDWSLRWRALHDPAITAQPCDRVAWLALDAAPARKLDGEVLRLRGREGEVRAWLDTHPEATSFGLAFAYDPQSPTGAHALQEAVCEGIPLIVWRRDDGDPEELAGRLGEMTSSQFSVLPDHLRLWRRAAARDDSADMHNHLALLWDDPECVRREGALAAPDARPRKS
ncbi:VMAP-C domain-containing protein [Streptomyces sp. NPDC054874]